MSSKYTPEELDLIFKKQCMDAAYERRRQQDPLYQLFEQIDRLALLRRLPTAEQLRSWADVLHAEINDDCQPPCADHIHAHDRPKEIIH